jgi:hypothetical protein
MFLKFVELQDFDAGKNLWGCAPSPKSQIKDPALAGGTNRQSVTAKAARRSAPLFNP